MRKKISKENGIIAADAALGIGILVVLSTIIIALVLNIYNVILSTHRIAIATDSAVEILENARLLNYYDSKLNQGEYTNENMLGVILPNGFNAKLDIKDYNKLQENQGKEDLIKILKLTINYRDGSLDKNITFSTLKINNNL